MKLNFVPPRVEMAEFFYELRQDPIGRQYNPLKPSSVEDLRVRLSKARSDWAELKNDAELMWFLELDSQWVGIVTVQNINSEMGTAEIGYTVAPAARGRGIATEAARWLTREAFAHTKLRKLIASVHEDNAASRRVLEKLGYRHEGLLREHYLIEGKPANEAFYGILRRELKGA